jgi:hypothetical protein
MARRPIPGVQSGPPAFPALSRPSAGPRPFVPTIKPAVQAKPGDSGNQAAPGQFGPSGVVSLPDPPKAKGPRVFQYKGQGRPPKG